MRLKTLFKNIRFLYKYIKIFYINKCFKNFLASNLGVFNSKKLSLP